MSDQNWGPGQPPQNQPPYGQMPPMPPQGYQPPTPAYPYATWISRVFASILDGFVVPLPGVILAIIGAVIAFSGSEVTTYDDGSVSAEGGNPIGVIVMVVGILAIFLIEVWNLVFRQGNTGQTLGKKWLGISVIRESDGVPLGPVMALLRWIMMAILGGACFLNYLWPLWDSKHQCWHDMVVRSVVVRAR
ncbi:RDD family protein [Rhodococcus erythropolis]|uniref:RDD family protein n=1 Tax=Rhodococcus erythropolis group TaxID=2840174 RepID=UPI0009367A85|nr:MULTISPECIES: RDD family protein [Rhodococcus erythropolis group]MCZ4544085.1 RDD family protein [Rhodococcus qingshengii]OKA12200.1 RDD family protein [Rhodococcus erythropolis]UJC76696.1 RDD family protein [Rhodococcus erythropolis]